MPKGAAAGPVRKVTIPILIGAGAGAAGCCACAVSDDASSSAIVRLSVARLDSRSSNFISRLPLVRPGLILLLFLDGWKETRYEQQMQPFSGGRSMIR